MPVAGQLERLGRLKPEASRQNRPNSLIIGAEIPFAQKRRQTELVLIQHGLGVQDALDGLQALFAALLRQKHNALCALVALSERHDHAHAGAHVEVRRNPVGIGLVDGKNSGANGDFRNHAHSSIYPCCARRPRKFVSF